MLVRRYSSGSAQPGDNCSNDLNIFSTLLHDTCSDMFDEGWTLETARKTDKVNNGTMPLNADAFPRKTKSDERKKDK